jgi:uridine kinase
MDACLGTPSGEKIFVVEQHFEAAVASILRRLNTIPPSRSLLVALTGIDGCGKGYVGARLRHALESRALRVAVINIDGWLNLPNKRFSVAKPAEHFYLNAIRFDEMFDQLVVPLREHRSVWIEADFAEETTATYRRHLYEFTNVDVIVLEGIYLLKREFRHHYDLSFWIDCTFDTAMKRAIARAQEGLSPQATVAAYRTIYFPAQEIHFVRDNPRAEAAIIQNDSDESVTTEASRSDDRVATGIGH